MNANDPAKGPEEKQPSAAEVAADPASSLDPHVAFVRTIFADALAVQADKEWADRLQEIGAKHVFAAAIIKEAQRVGCPERYIQRIGYNFIVQQTQKGEYGVVARFMKNMGFGTPEQIEYFDHLDRAKQIALGAEQEQIRAMEVGKRPTIELPEDATMADLFDAMDRAPPAVTATLKKIFWEMLGNFIPDFTELEVDRAKAVTISVADFFDGILSPEELEEPLPITWVSRKKK